MRGLANLELFCPFVSHAPRSLQRMYVRRSNDFSFPAVILEVGFWFVIMRGETRMVTLTKNLNRALLCLSFVVIAAIIIGIL